MKLRVFFLSLLFTMALQAVAQLNLRDSIQFAPLLDISYAYQVPGADLAKRFGFNSNLGGSFMIKTKKNWLIGVDGSFIFGNRIVDDSFLRPFEDPGGGIIGITGLYSNIQLYQRGFTFQAKVGKILPLFQANANSGVMVMFGAGFLQHKIRIEDEFQEVPLLNGSTAKGYDRLTNGFMISQFIGYRLMATNKLFNFWAGFEFMQGFTRNRRGFNYDTGLEDNAQRFDALNGFRIGATLPFYKKVPKEYYFD